jgi:hypothetical protein
VARPSGGPAPDERGGVGAADAAMNGQRTARDQWGVWTDAARRWLWAGVLVVVVVALLGAARYVKDVRQQVFVATQVVVVSVLPPDGGGAWSSAAADDAALQAAVAYGGATALDSAAALQALAAQERADQTLATAHFGQIGPGAVQGLDTVAPGAITVTHDGARIMVTARAGTAPGAWLLAMAGGQTLADEVARFQSAAQAAGQGASLRTVLNGAPSEPVRDPAPGVAARLRLVQTLLLGLVGGMLLVVAACAWDVRGRGPGAAVLRVGAAEG